MQYVLYEILGVEHLCSQIALILDVSGKRILNCLYAADSAVETVLLRVGGSHVSLNDSRFQGALIPIEIFLLG